MTSNRRDFLTKAAALSGASALAALLPATQALAQTADVARAAHTGTGTVSDPRVGSVKGPRILADAVPIKSRLRVDPSIWNWHRGTKTGGPSPANYYEASLGAWHTFDALPGDRDCDVVIVGGGLLGASTALHLAEAGVDVILVEQDHIGSGASGRNGGQLTPGIARWKAETMIEHYSPEEARRLWRLASVETMDLVEALSDRYGFSCDYKRGHLTAALHAGPMGGLVNSADARRQLGDTAVRIIGAGELKERYLRSNIYHGAAVDSMGGQAHPLALLRGLVYGLTGLGGRVYESTSVEAIEQNAGHATVITTQGAIRARKGVVLAVHGSTFRFLDGSPTTVPFYTYVSVTEPLNDAASLIPSDYAVYDTQLQIDYYRLVRNNRLLLGGQGTGNSWSPRDVNKYLLGRINTVFPQLGKPALEYSWGGISDLTLNGAADARKSDDTVPVYMVHGWSGHGVPQAVRVGKAISDDLTGLNDDFTMLTKVAHAGIPLGRFLSPAVIPVVKGALTMRNSLSPADMISF